MKSRNNPQANNSDLLVIDRSTDDASIMESEDFVKSTRQILRCFKDSGMSASRVGKLDNAHRRVQFNTFISQNKSIVNNHEQRISKQIHLSPIKEIDKVRKSVVVPNLNRSVVTESEQQTIRTDQHSILENAKYDLGKALKMKFMLNQSVDNKQSSA